MRRLLTAIAAAAALDPSLARAEPGDALAVTGDRVNLRDGAGSDSDVLTTLERGAALVEIERDGKWVRVRVEDGLVEEGWIHVSFVAPRAVEAGAPAQATPSAEEIRATARLAALELAVDQLDAAAQAQGYEFFGAVRAVGGKDEHVEVVATERWIAAPEGFRRSNFLAIESLWRSIVGAVGSVRIVDEDGEVLIESAPRIVDEPRR
ncbi:MAG: SH3 domain-containing protein [Alphaproteobacteria bacterium]